MDLGRVTRKISALNTDQLRVLRVTLATFPDSLTRTPSCRPCPERTAAHIERILKTTTALQLREMPWWLYCRRHLYCRSSCNLISRRFASSTTTRQRGRKRLRKQEASSLSVQASELGSVFIKFSSEVSSIISCSKAGLFLINQFHLDESFL